MATTPVFFSTVCKGIGPEDRDPGRQWTADLPARPDGSPCLNALEEAFEGALGDPDSANRTICATAYWGGFVVGTRHLGGDTHLYPMSAYKKLHGVRRIAADRARLTAEVAA